MFHKAQSEIQIRRLLAGFESHLFQQYQCQNTGIFTIHRVCTSYFVGLPVDQLETFSKCTQITKYENNWARIIIDNHNWDLADKLWEIKYVNVLSQTLHFENKARNENIFPGKRRKPWKLKCTRYWAEEWSSAQVMQHFDSALRFIGEHKTNCEQQGITLKDAIWTWTFNLFSRSSFEELMWTFEVACENGRVNVLHAIFVFCPQFEEDMKRRLVLSQYSRHLQTLEFAWIHIETHIRADAISWIRRAFNYNDKNLWQFLFDKGLLSQNIFVSIECDVEMSQSGNILAFVGCKPVEMVAAVWKAAVVDKSMSDMALLSIAQAIRLQAESVHNGPVLAFLNHVVSNHLRLICTHRLAALISPFKIAPVWNAYDQYADSKTSTTTREKIWAALQIANPTHFLQHAKPCFEMCVFLLDKKAIDVQTMLATLASKPQIDCQLLDDIRAHTYCIADES